MHRMREDDMEAPQLEIFDPAEVQVPKTCRQCGSFYEDPYPKCARLESSVVLTSLKPCTHFTFRQWREDDDGQ